MMTEQATAPRVTDVYITVDTEMWPIHRGGWPLRPLSSSDHCEREFVAYFRGETRSGAWGLPYQLRMLARHGLKATYFVDPMFSFALGAEKLASVIDLIHSHGQRVELHLHPEWLTDPRCAGLAQFRGPLLSSYPEQEQTTLVGMALARMHEAGATAIAAFRAGSWGCDLATLRAIGRAGLSIDSSLNAAFEHSLPSLSRRGTLHEPVQIHGITEVPVTRFADGVSRLGRSLSLVGVSIPEMRTILDRCHAAGRRSIVIVMHSNEFTRTDLLWRDREPLPRRLVTRRFEWLCAYLAAESARFRTRSLSDLIGQSVDSGVQGDLPKSSLLHTMRRAGEQLICRWY